MMPLYRNNRGELTDFDVEWLLNIIDDIDPQSPLGLVLLGLEVQGLLTGTAENLWWTISIHYETRFKEACPDLDKERLAQLLPDLITAYALLKLGA